MTNAIILAAGLGSRMRPITDYCHKALIIVNGKPLIEHQIEVYISHQVTNIFIVAGYRWEDFLYLEEKFQNVKIILNKNYKKYNNFYSIFLLKDALSDCYISEGDIYFKKNVKLVKFDGKSRYFVKRNSNHKKEWRVFADLFGKINMIKIDYSFNQEIACGITYLNQHDGDLLSKELSRLDFDTLSNPQAYWDEYLIENLSELSLYRSKINDEDIFEIDDANDLMQLLKN
ncbi:NTP transferase domain-containing protein [Solibacillus cecembensis]|uniref:NTP transferase domain-containing protein n=1 Tax=Solibacillus cecembensis TaxID=459347 RepID=UPI003CFC6237